MILLWAAEHVKVDVTRMGRMHVGENKAPNLRDECGLGEYSMVNCAGTWRVMASREVYLSGA